MNHSVQAGSFRERLIHQLIVLGEEKHSFLDAYFPKQGVERKQTQLFLAEYVQFVENELAAVETGQSPAVFIGCEVTIDYIDYQTKDSFKIVYPMDADPEQNCISFLSPVGKQLLMSRRDEVINVATPAGAMRVRMLHIH
jgi:transcription elongation factor GreA